MEAASEVRVLLFESGFTQEGVLFLLQSLPYPVFHLGLQLGVGSVDSPQFYLCSLQLDLILPYLVFHVLLGGIDTSSVGSQADLGNYLRRVVSCYLSDCLHVYLCVPSFAGFF